MNELSKRFPSLSSFAQFPDGHLQLTRAVSRVARSIYGKNWTGIERPRLERAQTIVLGWLAKEDLMAWEGVTPITPSFWFSRGARYAIEHGRKLMDAGRSRTTITVDETALDRLLKELEPSNSEKRAALPDGAPLTEAQKGGRPTYENEIQKAGQSLLDSDEIDPATSQKKTADKVRKLVQENVGTSDNRGLSDQTIRRHLKPILDAHGKARG